LARDLKRLGVPSAADVLGFCLLRFFVIVNRFGQVIHMKAA
jgi:hypothetical protein